METEQVYFLLLVAAGIALLLVLVWRLEKNHQAKIKARKEKSRARALRQPRRVPGRAQVIRGQTVSFPSHGLSARTIRNQHAEDLRDGSSFTASKLTADDEEPSEESAGGPGKRAIEYPVRGSSQKQRSRR